MQVPMDSDPPYVSLRVCASALSNATSHAGCASHDRRNASPALAHVASLTHHNLRANACSIRTFGMKESAPLRKQYRHLWHSNSPPLPKPMKMHHMPLVALLDRKTTQVWVLKFLVVRGLDLLGTSGAIPGAEIFGVRSSPLISNPFPPMHCSTQGKRKVEDIVLHSGEIGVACNDVKMAQIASTIDLGKLAGNKVCERERLSASSHVCVPRASC